MKYWNIVWCDLKKLMVIACAITSLGFLSYLWETYPIAAPIIVGILFIILLLIWYVHNVHKRANSKYSW